MLSKTDAKWILSSYTKNKIIANQPQHELIKLQKELERKNQVIAEQDELKRSYAMINKKLQEDLKLYKGKEENTVETTTTKGS